MRTASLLGMILLALYVASLLGGDVPMYVALALVGLLVIVVPLTLLTQRSDELSIGIDGVRTPREFFPWESIQNVELDNDTIVIHGHDGYRGWVAPRHPGQSHREILDKLEQLEQGTLRTRHVVHDIGRSYREEGAKPPEILVRIAQDPTYEEDRRVDAFSRLDSAHRLEVLDELADDDFRRRLEALPCDAAS